MKAQLQTMSVFITIFFIAFHCSIRSSTAVGPASADIYTSTFFNVVPALSCYSDSTRNSGSLAGETNLRRLKLDGGSNDADTVQGALGVFLDELTGATSTSDSLSAQQVPGGQVCASETSGGLKGSDECREKEGGVSVHGFQKQNPIVTCVFDELNKTVHQPENLGSIACDCAKKSHNPLDTCNFVAFLSTFVSCSAVSKCPILEAKPYVPPEGEFVSLPMQGTLPTPARVSKTVIDSERQTYYLLYKAFALLSYDAQQSLCDPHYDASSTLPGWDIQLTTNLVAAKTKTTVGERVPFARLSKRPNGQNKNLTDFLIAVRGTMTFEEWGIDYSYNQIFGEIHQLGSAPIHRGFAALAAAVWAPLKPFIQEAFDRGQLGLITITGHSLGGGGAVVLSHLASTQFPIRLPGTVEPRIRVVTFGGGRSGGEKLMSDLGSRVVMRTVEGYFDPIPKFPCDQIIGCPASIVPVSTSRDLRSVYAYAEGPGTVLFTARDLPAAFSQSFLFNVFLLLPWHNCAYDCWTSEGADPDHLGSCLAPSPLHTGPLNSTVCYSLPPSKKEP